MDSQREKGWLSDLLADGAGITCTAQGIEISAVPGGTYYVYCDYPGQRGGERVHIGLCQEYGTLEHLMKGLNCHTGEELDKLTPGDLIPLYKMGMVSMNAYLADDERPCNLVFRQGNDITLVMDHEKNALYMTDLRLDTAEALRIFTQRYAAGLVHLEAVPMAG